MKTKKDDISFISDKKVSKIRIDKKDKKFSDKSIKYARTKFTSKILAQKTLNTVDKFSDENDGAKLIAESANKSIKVNRTRKKVKNIKTKASQNKNQKRLKKSKKKIESKLSERTNKNIKLKQYDSKKPKDLIENKKDKIVLNKENVKEVSKFGLDSALNTVDKFSDENDGAKLLAKPYIYGDKIIDSKNKFQTAKNTFFKKKNYDKNKGLTNKLKEQTKKITDKARKKVINTAKNLTRKIAALILKITSPLIVFFASISLIILLVLSVFSSEENNNRENNFFELPIANSPQEFFEIYGEAFKNVGEEYNIYASVMMAQAILESNFGKNIAGSNNLFGIKCYNEKYGCTKPLKTQEEVDGEKINIKSSFQQSPEYGIEGAIKLYVDFLANGSSYKEYSRTLTKSYHSTYRSVTKAIVEKLKYATDSSYTEKLNKIISDYDLTKYDTPENPNKKILENIELRIDEGFATNSDLGLPVYNDYKTFNNYITSRFGPRRSPVKGASSFHKGLDIGGKAGTPIYSVADGVIENVKYPFPNQTYGGLSTGVNNYIVVKHSNELSTAYLHLKSINVKVGDKVKKGQIIGTMGSTGFSSGVHLHFEVRINGKQIDPEIYLKNINQ